MGTYYRFMAFNVVSFSFLAGNIIILYALRLGASNALVGAIAASYQLTFLFTLIGRRIVHRVGAVKLFGRFWAIRYVLMVPVIFTTLPALNRNAGIALTVVAVAALLFNAAKGIGLTAMRPIVGELPPPRERGAFLSSVQLIVQIAAIATGLIMAAVLGEDQPLSRYSLLISLGVLAGFFAAYHIMKLPEPAGAAEGFSRDFRSGVAGSLKPGPFRRLTFINSGMTFVIALAAAFLIVYFKRVYAFADGSIVLFTVAGNVGAMLMAILSRSLLDRIGAKALLFTFGSLITLVLLPVILSPQTSGGWRWVFPILVYFFFMMGQFGVLNTVDAFFFSITDPKDRLDRGIVFGLSTGIAGSAGGLIGGAVLSGLEALIPSLQGAFAAFFAVAAVVVAVATAAVIGLPDVASISMQDALGALVSPRDLRAIRLLNRLRRSKTVGEEQAAVAALRETSSKLPLEELARRVASPSLAIRIEAIGALRNSPLDSATIDLLIEEVRHHQFTTAHIAAEILGNARAEQAIAVLRESVRSPDYMLSAKAMVALGTIGDTGSVPMIEAVLERSENPRVTIYAVKALELLGSVRSLPLIIAVLDASQPLSVRDELILSIAGLLGLQEWFYPLYLEYLDDASSAIESLRLETQGNEAKSTVVAAIGASDEHFAKAAGAYFQRRMLRVGALEVGQLISGAMQRESARGLDRFRFLVAALVCALRSEERPVVGDDRRSEYDERG